MTLPAALARPALAPLWVAARRRLEGNGGRLTEAPLVVTDLDAAGLDALAGILGTARPPAGPVRISLPKLDAALRRSVAGTGVVGVLEALGGPLRDRRAERHAARMERDALHDVAVTRMAALPDAEGWVERLRSIGLLRRLSEAGDPLELIEQAAAVLGSLAAGGTLAGLAATVTGDSHALDRDRPLGRLVVDALAFTDGVPVPASAAGWRALWAEHGIACDDLSSDVLVLNLRLGDAGVLGRVLGELADAGEPARLTLRQAAGVTATTAGRIFVCENPAVVAAAADRLGASSAPIVCVSGQPSTAALALLRALAAGGADLAYHGDFDWGGIAIANLVLARAGARPWRFTAADYRSAAGSGLPLGSRPVAASWDPTLLPAMVELGVAVHEEQVLGDLLADLGG
jgi:uncharacterized protein (TIGR02679 family)